MRDIADYKVVRTSELNGPDGLISQVRSALAEGWQPIGGISYSITGSYVQAMVKYAPPPNFGLMPG